MITPGSSLLIVSPCGHVYYAHFPERSSEWVSLLWLCLSAGVLMVVRDDGVLGWNATLGWLWRVVFLGLVMRGVIRKCVR